MKTRVDNPTRDLWLTAAFIATPSIILIFTLWVVFAPASRDECELRGEVTARVNGEHWCVHPKHLTPKSITKTKRLL